MLFVLHHCIYAAAICKQIFKIYFCDCVYQKTSIVEVNHFGIAFSFFTTRCYASMVYAVMMCLSICHKLTLYQIV